jgi:1,4-alpha-glucan branching enzyme
MRKNSRQGKSLAKNPRKGVDKQYLKVRPTCKVTFRFPKEAAPEAESVTIVGDFNNWSVTETPMRRMKNGDFKVTLELPCDREYRFRYLIDAHCWENDCCADKHIPTSCESEDSVVVV